MTEDRLIAANTIYGRIKQTRRILDCWSKCTYFTDADERLYIEIPEEIKVQIKPIIESHLMKLQSEFNELE